MNFLLYPGDVFFIPYYLIDSFLQTGCHVVPIGPQLEAIAGNIAVTNDFISLSPDASSPYIISITVLPILGEDGF